MAAEDLEVTYCEGWDPTALATVGVLPVAAARERDLAGEQYAVLLGHPRRPYALIEVAWGAGYAGVWLFDGSLRRAAKHEFRRLDDRLFLLETVERRYEREGQAEFDPVAWRHTRRYETDGGFEQSLEPAGEGGGLRMTWGNVPVDTLWEAVPRFGAWASLARRERDRPSSLTLSQPADSGPASDSGPHPDRGAGTPGQPPWRPPRPLAPTNLHALFRAGTRFARSWDDGSVTTVKIRLRELGRLRMPTGRLVVADPAMVSSEHEPFTVAAPPGEYPLALAMARSERAGMGPDQGLVAAARLLVRDEPVEAWELALRAGQDPRLLGDGQFFGFGVDSGKACVVDAGTAGHLIAIEEDHDRYRGTYLDASLDEGVEVTDPATGANAFVFPSGKGDGAYPVWIGRTAAGDVASFVVDLLVLHRATLLQ